MSFEALQRRAAARPRGAAGLAVGLPAYFVAFDVLQLDSQELLQRPYEERRQLLEELFTDQALTAPWTLCPMTTDLAEAREWLESWTDVSGVEGLVIKPLTSRYLPGYRGWTKVRRRDTTEAIIGAITGTLTRPGFLVLGRYDAADRLRAVGRTVPLRPDVSRQVGEHLAEADPGHPFEGVRFTAAWGSRDVLDVVLVRPELVAEVSADRAVDWGAFRHPLRFTRLRLDVSGRCPAVRGRVGCGGRLTAGRAARPAPADGAPQGSSPMGSGPRFVSPAGVNPALAYA
ncbi:ATP-dependent DNA ligase [Streptomyces sp. NPDC051211]|uniref:ATP-dependent DNA ligase n=1 Tax=Streptomyces sp. NPDC051211 TaxID=3154643 RepID=UPI00344DAD7E